MSEVSAALLVRFAMEVDRVRKYVIQISSSYGLKGKFIQDCCQSILDEIVSREKPMSDDHIKQQAVKWCKSHKSEMDEYWKEFYKKPTREEYEEMERKRLGAIHGS